ncbi:MULTISPECIES: hypothetical protein [Pseudomonas]|uniref:Spore coat protein U domain-containing protein n=1 Tax=Pseudomonas graminis TaxID=158627 RepID=A0A1C2D8F8_9PSED|nr:hypothetical protein [Pseudomonas graminis]OCX11005.1 hypothetical protein BBI10_22575 [Pseudomonas graminis]
MFKKKMTSLILAASLASLAGVTAAQPIASTMNFCTKISGAIPAGTVNPGEQQVIYGPYTVTCGTTSHHFNVTGASGQVPVFVQQLQAGSWSSVTGKTYDPSGLFGAGTFRLVIDNVQSPVPTSYSGSYVVPM